MKFDYFYTRDGDRFSYYMLPKIIGICKKPFVVDLANFVKRITDFLNISLLNIVVNLIPPIIRREPSLS